MDLHLVLFIYKHAVFTTNHPVIIDSIIIIGIMRCLIYSVQIAPRIPHTHLLHPSLLDHALSSAFSFPSSSTQKERTFFSFFTQNLLVQAPPCSPHLQVLHPST